MADGFIDSNYGSLSGMQSSSSSFSMSLSGSDTVEDQPSTSGCSSDMTHSKQQKERRKERVKHYLKQLKAMVPPTVGSRGKMGTLSALQHVVDSMKKIQEGKEKTALEKQDVLEKSLNASLYEGEGQLPEQTLKTSDCLRITLRSRDFTIMNVSPNLHKLLGYPMLSWNGRDLIHFIHKKDVVTVNSNLAYESENVCASNEREDENEQDDVRKYFYFRIRHYKSLQSGFSLMKADQYTAFQASVVLKTQGSGADYTNLNVNMNLNETEDKSPHKYLILECVPLKSAYGIDNLSLERFTFITRHTLFCSFSYMHHNAIPLLGYLPQDLVGMSIFDFYHSDDLESLYNTYKQVVSAKGTPIKGAPIRFRARNGSYVYLETEWSSFANPWSRRLEFIIGQHTVIKSPKNRNVFSDIVSSPVPEPCENVQKTQQKIRQLLLKPIVENQSEDIPSSSQDEKTTPPTFSVVRCCKRRRILLLNSESEEELRKVEKLSPSVEQMRDDIDRKPQIASTSDASLSSQQLFQDNGTSVAYEQLNYTNNIKKFLLSQPRSYSSKSDSKSDNKSPSSNEESDEVEFQEPEQVPETVDEFEVDISVPKPPSFGSSTKVLLSEQGQREEVASSPAHHNEDITEESEPLKETLPTPPPPVYMPTIVMPPPPPPVMEKEDHPKLMHLTQEALIKHTRLQEKIFVSQATHDRNIMMKHQDMTGIMAHDSQGMKRTHSPDSDMWVSRGSKAYKQEQGDLLQPPFPLSVQQQELSFEKSQALKTAHSLMDGSFPGSPLAMYPAGVPCSVSSDVSINSVASGPPTKQTVQRTVASNMTGKMQWPYYPQAGVSFIPQVMGGFYQPQQPAFTQVMGQSTLGHPVTLQGSSMIPVTMLPSTHTNINTRGMRIPTCGYSYGGGFQPLHSDSGTKITAASDMSSTEETSSSYLYLLELDENNSATPEEMDGIRTQCGGLTSGSGLRKRVTEPPWLQTVHWTPKLALLYTVPRRKKHRILKEDRDAMCKMKSSDLVVEQMKALQEEACSEPKSPVVDEESDYLFPLEEDELQKLMESAEVSSDQDSSEMSECSMERGEDDILSSEVMGLENGADLCPENKEAKNNAETYDKNESENVSEKSRDEKAMSCDSGDQEADESPKENMESASRKSDGESSSVECESDYSKTSSNLTPSDQRSNEEACSSIKESDGSIKEMETSSKNSDFSSNDNKSSSESDQDTKKVPVSAPFDVFFVPLPVKFYKKNKKSVPWLEETELNKVVEMEFSVTSENLQNRLKHDKLRLRDMKQPELVKQQFDAMVEELNLQKISSPKLHSRQDSHKRESQGGPGALLGPVSPKRLSSHQKQREVRRKSKIDDKLFEGLFISMFNEEKEERLSKSDSYPDIEDVSNSLDEID